MKEEGVEFLWKSTKKYRDGDILKLPGSPKKVRVVHNGSKEDLCRSCVLGLTTYCDPIKCYETLPEISNFRILKEEKGQ